MLLFLRMGLGRLSCACFTEWTPCSIKFVSEASSYPGEQREKKGIGSQAWRESRNCVLFLFWIGPCEEERGMKQKSILFPWVSSYQNRRRQEQLQLALITTYILEIILFKISTLHKWARYYHIPRPYAFLFFCHLFIYFNLKILIFSTYNTIA